MNDFIFNETFLVFSFFFFMTFIFILERFFNSFFNKFYGTILFFSLGFIVTIGWLFLSSVDINRFQKVIENDFFSKNSYKTVLIENNCYKYSFDGKVIKDIVYSSCSSENPVSISEKNSKDLNDFTFVAKNIQSHMVSHEGCDFSAKNFIISYKFNNDRFGSFINEEKISVIERNCNNGKIDYIVTGVSFLGKVSG